MYTTRAVGMDSRKDALIQYSKHLLCGIDLAQNRAKW